MEDKGKLLLEVWQESWRQYSHEDNLWQSRDRFFLSIETVLFTGFAFVCWWTLRADLSESMNSLLPPLFVSGLVTWLLSAAGLGIAFVWKHATRASRAMAFLRWLSAYNAEIELNVGDSGIATLEDKWRIFIESHPDEDFIPFPGHNILGNKKVFKIGRVRGYNGTLLLIGWVRAVWLVVAALGILFVVFGACNS